MTNVSRKLRLVRKSQKWEILTTVKVCRFSEATGDTKFFHTFSRSLQIRGFSHIMSSERGVTANADNCLWGVGQGIAKSRQLLRMVSFVKWSYESNADNPKICWHNICTALTSKKQKEGNRGKGESLLFLRGKVVQNEGKFLQEPATTKKRQNIVSNTKRAFPLNPMKFVGSRHQKEAFFFSFLLLDWVNWT